MTSQAPNHVFSVPSREGNSQVPPERFRPLTPEDLQRDRQAIADEASRLALSGTKLGNGNTPLFYKTAELLEDRERMKLSPQVEEFRRLTSSLSIMQDNYIEQLFKGHSFKSFSSLLATLGIRQPSEEDRETIRKKLIDEETLLSEVIFANNPAKPADKIWRFHQVEGHFYWEVYDKGNPDTSEVLVHYAPTYDGAEKTVTFADNTMVHASLAGHELDAILKTFNKYENLVAQRIYLPPQPRHRAE